MNLSKLFRNLLVVTLLVLFTVVFSLLFQFIGVKPLWSTLISMIIILKIANENGGK